MTPRFNECFDFFLQFADDVFLRYGADVFAFAKQHGFLHASGDTDIGTTGFLRAIDGATHDRYRDIGIQGVEVFLHLFYDRQHVILDSSAGRASNQIRGLIVETETFQ